jgi:hypothetical protein
MPQSRQPMTLERARRLSRMTGQALQRKDLPPEMRAKLENLREADRRNVAAQLALASRNDRPKGK